MKINRLLEAHSETTQKSSLSRNLGDGFLLEKNRIFKNIRRATMGSGFQLTNNFDLEFLAFPFGQLESILSKKTIPYLDNVTVLEKMELQSQGQVAWDEITDGFRRNFIFHESCHAVIRTTGQKIFSQKIDSTSLKNRQRICLHMLLEESFANTCELLGGVLADDNIHKLFYEINSYTFLFESQNHIQAAQKSLGEKFVFKFFLLTYLFSNFLFNQLDDKQFKEVILLSGGNNLEPKVLKNLKALARIPFTLDFRFRTTTTGLHLKLNGISQKMDEVLDFDFLNIIKNEKAYLDLIEAVTVITIQ